MASRETIITALLAKLAAGGAFKTIGRRNRDPESIPTDETPALLLVKLSEKIERVSPNLSAKRVLNMMAYVYTDVGSDENAIPETPLNNALDSIEAALAPDDPTQNKCTLGGLVFYAQVEGDIDVGIDASSGKAIQSVPIRVLIP